MPRTGSSSERFASSGRSHPVPHVMIRRFATADRYADARCRVLSVLTYPGHQAVSLAAMARLSAREFILPCAAGSQEGRGNSSGDRATERVFHVQLDQGGFNEKIRDACR